MSRKINRLTIKVIDEDESCFVVVRYLCCNGKLRTTLKWHFVSELNLVNVVDTRYDENEGNSSKFLNIKV